MSATTCVAQELILVSASSMVLRSRFWIWGLKLSEELSTRFFAACCMVLTASVIMLPDWPTTCGACSRTMDTPQEMAPITIVSSSSTQISALIPRLTFSFFSANRITG